MANHVLTWISFLYVLSSLGDMKCNYLHPPEQQGIVILAKELLAVP